MLVASKVKISRSGKEIKQPKPKKQFFFVKTYISSIKRETRKF